MIAAAAPASRFSVRAISLLLTTVLLAQSAFATPEAASYAFISLGEIGREAKSTWQKTDLSRFLNTEFPASLAALVTTKANTKAEVQFDRILIRQRDRTILQGESLNFTATAFRGDQSVGGVSFRWTITNRQGASRTLLNGKYEATLPGSYVVRATANGFYAETTLTVTRNESFE